MKLIKKTAAFILVLLFVFALSACGTTRSIKRIYIADGSFSDIYSLNAQLDLSNARLAVVYDNNSTEIVAITADMVSGFDTSTTTDGRTLQIKYRGQTAEFVYKVSSDTSIDTAVRFALSTGTDSNGNYVSIAVENADKDEFFAMSYKLTIVGANFASSAELVNKELYAAETVFEDGIYGFAAVAKDGVTPFTDGVISRVYLSSVGLDSFATLSVGIISDGDSVKKVPSGRIELGGAYA